MNRIRIHVPMSAETRADLQTLADARGCSLAAVCRDLLEQTAPVAKELAQALSVAQEAPARAYREIQQLKERQIADIDQHTLDLAPKKAKRKKTG